MRSAGRQPGALVDFAGLQVAQRDAFGHRADRDTQVAAHALVLFHLEMALAVFDGGNGLVRGVLAGNVAAPALDAAVLLDHRLADVVEVEVTPFGDRWQGAAPERVN